MEMKIGIGMGVKHGLLYGRCLAGIIGVKRLRKVEKWEGKVIF